VPEQGQVSVDLVVGDGKVAPVVRARFAQWRARLPAPLNETAGFERKAGRITLSIPFPRHRQLVDPYFYPASDHVLDYAAPQRVTRRGNRLIVEAKAAVDGQPVAVIEGVLATGSDRGFSLAASPR
jgi:DsbC/DsbD-like thiol-disulfide interchange protein